MRSMAPLRVSFNSFVMGLISLGHVTRSVMSFSTPSPTTQQSHQYRNILILDHLNINHQKSRHDLLKAFYFDFLQCGIDPRKAENIEKGSETLWANIGAQQFHLPEGKPDAQVLNGEIRLCYSPLEYHTLLEFGKKMEEHELLRETQFKVVNHNDERMSVIDPWGSKFEIISSEKVKDPRGVQDNIDDAESLGNGIDNVTIYAPSGANMVGIARFYEKVMDTPALIVEENQCIVSMGPHQTLTFQSIQKDDGDINMHVDLRDEQDKNPEGQQYYPSNYGPHISLYVRDIRSTYKRADELGVTYVNPRFSRRAYCEEEVVKDCMFRCLDIVDPDNVNEGVILRLEHEVRSVLKFDGSLYNSCPFVKVPDGCVI